MDRARTDTPPRTWELSTFVLLAGTGAAGVGSVLMTAFYVYAYVSIDEGRPPAPTVSIGFVPVVAYLLVLIAFVAAQSWWSWSTRRMLLGFGVAPEVLRHWAKKAFLGLFALSCCCGLAQGYANPFPAHFDQEQWLAAVETSAVSMAIRGLAFALLGYAGWVVRADIRRAVAATRHRLGHAPPPAGPATAPTTPLP
ncbi:hypothetical protein ODJ79_46240 [Actinoplanes sp. KI2]|uniref:hypothetical protein n=1 Tax=Actinoplanes sp. KI2 TaxID=2983315 RepID=UPI0021D574B3|nr:hypothetical protein [Actinoplanes sp. KI2]MCU7731158.1 hypothetical protein [Actinoplanes sp. KI2]